MFNEGRYIAACLQSVLSGTYPHDCYEIIVADGRSTDDSRQIVSAIAAEHANVRIIDNPGRTVPRGMNLGLMVARGDYIVRMDGHSEYPPDYIHNCITELERTGADNVGGCWITEAGSPTVMGKAIAMLTQSPIAVGNAYYRTGSVVDRYVDTVPFGAFRRELFERIGFFREDLTRHQDYELNARIRKSGGRIYLSSRIHNRYFNSPTFSKFMRQAHLNGIWVARAWLRYPISFAPRHAAPFGFMLVLLGCAATALFWHWMIWVLAVVVALYLVAVSLASLKIALHNGFVHLLVAPVLIICYHFLYSLGTIYGLLTPGLSARSIKHRKGTEPLRNRA